MNLIGKVDEYEAQKTQSGLTPGLKKILHSIDWPIDLDTPNIHLAGFFDKHDYITEKDYKHESLDIQLPEHTEVFAPEDVKLVDCRFDEDIGFINMWGLKSRLLYTFSSLDYGSIPSKIRSSPAVCDRNYKNFVIEKGSSLGKIATWPGDLDQSINIPKDVEEIYGRSYNHLRIRTENCRGGLRAYPFHNDLQVRMVNPLQFLKELE